MAPKNILYNTKYKILLILKKYPTSTKTLTFLDYRWKPLLTIKLIQKYLV